MILRASKQRLRKRALYVIGAMLCIGHLLFFFIELRGTVQGYVCLPAGLAALRTGARRGLLPLPPHTRSAAARPLAELERVSFHTLARRLSRGGGRGAGPSSLEATGIDARPLRQRRRRGDAAAAAARRSGGLDLLDEDDSGYDVDLAQEWGNPTAPLPAKRRQGKPADGAGPAGDADAGLAYDDEADYYEPAEPKPRARKKKKRRRKKRRGKLRGASGSGRKSEQAGAMENFLRSTGRRFDETLEEEELRDEVYVQLGRALNIGFGEAKELRGEAFDVWLARASNPLACFLVRIGCVSVAPRSPAGCGSGVAALPGRATEAHLLLRAAHPAATH